MLIKTGMLGGVVLAALSGCALDAGVTDDATRVGSTSAALNPGDLVWVPNPSSYASCKLVRANGVSFDAPPTWVVRITNAWVQAAAGTYGFSGQYMLPFPTPWIGPTWTGGFLPDGDKAGSGCLNPLPSPTLDCAYGATMPAYEQELLQNVPTIVHHEFLVYTLTNCVAGCLPPLGSTCVPAEQCTAGTAAFYNGTPANLNDPSNNHVAGRNQTVQDYQSDPNVQPVGLNCVYVMDDPNQNGVLSYSGFHAFVAQAHLPIAYPN